ncbi:MAG TPA: DUF1501 domain-containing protein [Planctomycetaceae bacterium]|nr:DUF1501 domain-containing protein [Planctomycetaceae bacterium]
MLRILGSANPFRHGCNRREAMCIGGFGAAAAWSPFLPVSAQAQESTAALGAFGKAKRVILLYLQGAASQFETWDPKPEAPLEVRGKWSATSTSVPGVTICDQLPRLSRLVDRMAIVRSMTHAHNNHSNLYTLSGFPAVDFSSETNPFDGRHHPFFGSVLDYLADQNAAVRPEVPRNMGLPFKFSAFGQLARRAGPYATFLGQGYDPVWTEFAGRATKKVSRVSFFDRLASVDVEDPYLGVTPDSRLRVSQDAQLRPGLTLDRLDARRTLVQQLDAQQRHLADTLSAKTVDRFSEMAYSFIGSQNLREALDVGREPMALREQYGMTLFGQSALTARRLLEAGCRMVSVFWDEYKIVNTAWDTHFDHFTRLGDELLPGFDAAASSLLLDLETRGMLDDTLVLCLSEHGRTPKINNHDRGGGRDHWSQVYSVMLAGAGIRRGTVVGASDAQGAFVKERPIGPEDILATMYHLTGVSPETTIPDRLQRPVRLVDNGSVVDELLA